MARTKAAPTDLEGINAQRERLKAQLAQLDEAAKVAEAAELDAGRPLLISALDRVKIGKMDKADAKAIASAVAQFGGKAIAEHLASLQSA